jgi:hypothetical protein
VSRPLRAYKGNALDRAVARRKGATRPGLGALAAADYERRPRARVLDMARRRRGTMAPVEPADDLGAAL